MMNAKKLAETVLFTIQEMYVKINYSSGAVSLYYPMSDLDIQPNTTDRFISEFCTAFKSYVGDIECQIDGDRLNIVIPESTCKRIENIPTSPILETIVDAVKDHVSVLELRRRLLLLSDSMVWKDLNDCEVDSAIHFTDGIDDHVYCIKTEMGHLIYHRFSMNDYIKLGYETTSDLSDGNRYNLTRESLHR